MDQGSMLFYLSKLQKCRTLLSHLYFPNLCLQAAKIFYDFTVFVISRIHGQQSFFLDIYLFQSCALNWSNDSDQPRPCHVQFVTQGLVIIYVEVGEEKKEVGVKAQRSGGAKLFYKEVQGGEQFDRKVDFKRGPLAKMGKAVKQQNTNNICETVMLNCTILC